MNMQESEVRALKIMFEGELWELLDLFRMI